MCKSIDYGKSDSQLCCQRLYGKHDVTIPIVDNRIIVVGANGLGKEHMAECFLLSLVAPMVTLGRA